MGIRLSTSPRLVTYGSRPYGSSIFTTAVSCYSAVIRVESEINTGPLSYKFKSDSNRLHRLPYIKGCR